MAILNSDVKICDKLPEGNKMQQPLMASQLWRHRWDAFQVQTVHLKQTNVKQRNYHFSNTMVQFHFPNLNDTAGFQGLVTWVSQSKHVYHILKKLQDQPKPCLRRLLHIIVLLIFVFIILRSMYVGVIGFLG